MWTRQSIIEKMMKDVINPVRSSWRISAALNSRLNASRCVRRCAPRAREIILARGSSLFLVG